MVDKMIKNSAILKPRNPTVRDAKDLCSRLRARSVLIITINDDTVSGASYANTKMDCRSAGYTLDHIIQSIEDETIPVWADPRIEQQIEHYEFARAVALGDSGEL